MAEAAAKAATHMATLTVETAATRSNTAKVSTNWPTLAGLEAGRTSWLAKLRSGNANASAHQSAAVTTTAILTGATCANAQPAKPLPAPMTAATTTDAAAGGATSSIGRAMLRHNVVRAAAACIAKIHRAGTDIRWAMIHQPGSNDAWYRTSDGRTWPTQLAPVPAVTRPEDF